ncbi:MAG: restriction endonuclease subunit S [Psychrobacter sp.]
MANDWIIAKLGDVLEIKYGKDHKKLNDGDIPCFGSGGIMRYVENSIYEQESILIPRKGSLNNIYYVDQPFWTVDTLFWTKINPETVFTKFLFYQLKLTDFVSLNVGSAVPSLTVPVLNDLTIKLPPLPEQKAIAHILSSLDDKIELNRQMNETLEAMAQSLFKSWFVDFDPVIDNALAAGNAIPDELFERAEQRKEVEKKDHSDINTLFPDEFELTEGMGWIPKGWEVKSLSEVTENIFSGGTPNTKKAEYWNGGLKWFSSGETRESIVIETEKNITEIGVSESSTKLARYGDVLIASAGQGHTRGQTSFCSIDTYFNQSVVCVRPQKSIHYSWLFFNLYGRYEEMRGLSDSHSIRGSLTTKLLLSMLIIKPNENILAEYENIIGTHILKIKEKKLINNNIAKLRDTLLPKLMSGEIRIPDAEALVNESI